MAHDAPQKPRHRDSDDVSDLHAYTCISGSDDLPVEWADAYSKLKQLQNDITSLKWDVDEQVKRLKTSLTDGDLRGLSQRTEHR